jgi:hypothetical protein
MVDPARAIGASTKVSAPTQPYLPWGGSPAGGDEVTAVEVTFSGVHTTSWTWGEDHWSRVDSLAAAGDEFQATTVLILRVTTRDAGYQDPAGNPVPETVLEGSGEAMMLTGGTAIPARWSKGDPADPIGARPHEPRRCTARTRSRHPGLPRGSPAGACPEGRQGMTHIRYIYMLRKALRPCAGGT